MANRSDNFNRGGGGFLTSSPTPSDGGSNWICDTTVSAGHYFVSSATLEWYLGGNSVLECGNTDHEAQVVAVTAGGIWGVIVAYVDVNNFIFLESTHISDTVRWKVRTAGVDTTLKTITQHISNGDTVAFGRSGTTLTFKLNGSTIDTSTSSAHAAATKAGLYCGSAGGRWDDFAITAAGGGGPLAAGTPIGVSTPTGVTIYCDGTNGSTAASGGTDPLSYQWYGSTTSNFTPGGGNILSGETSENLTVSSPTTTLTFYKQIVTDSAGSPATATSVEAPGRLLDGALRVLFIGDSIYYNGTDDPPARFAEYAAYLGHRLQSVTTFNASAPGSGVNYWLPDTDPAYIAWDDTGPNTGGLGLLAWAKSQLAVSGTTFAVIRLGANDSGIAAATWGTRMGTIVSNLTAAGYTVVLNYPTYGRPGGSYGGAANARFQEFQSQIAGLVDEPDVYLGDTGQWDASAVVNTWRGDDIHPADEGQAQLALADLLRLGEILYPAAASAATVGRVIGG